MATFHDFEMTSITGEPVSFDQFRGQHVLAVNVASACGLTPQYAGLQALHDDNDDVTVLGFPCNQFAGQEPGTDEEICEFASSTYGVTFPLFHKIDVNGEGTAPLYEWLKSEAPGEGDSSDIMWNFEKFLLDGDGNVVRRFPPTTPPEEIAEFIASAR